MSFQAKGDCRVCGAETTKRCGACQSAGVDLFFCSREHQKLVWKTHGKVCGASSNPFHTSRKTDWTPEKRSSALSVARESLHMFVTGANAQPEHFRTMNPFTHAATLHGTLEHPFPLSPWARTLAHHLALVLATLIHPAFASSPPPPYEQDTLDLFCRSTFQRLLRHLRAAWPALTLEEYGTAIKPMCRLVFSGLSAAVLFRAEEGDDIMESEDGWTVDVLKVSDVPEGVRTMMCNE
ncbi:hypothetical protein JCM10207_001659 [Rhodosporidiobolus poonsookiae]